MTIERLHFDEGYPIEKNLSITDLNDILVKNRDKIKALPEGRYNLVPEIWKSAPMDYELMVLKNGNGICREGPHSSDFGTDNLVQQGDGQDTPKDKITYLPQTTDLVTVTAPIKGTGKKGIYDIIRHVPGISPGNESEIKGRELIPAGAI